jgi:hypothetical protein
MRGHTIHDFPDVVRPRTDAHELVGHRQRTTYIFQPQPNPLWSFVVTMLDTPLMRQGGAA